MNIAKTKYMSLSTDTNYLEVDNGDITGFWTSWGVGNLNSAIFKLITMLE
jgi:hypothetical protein